MGPRAALMLVVVLTLTQMVMAVPPVDAHPPRSDPQLAGSMPDLEGSILRALETANLTGQLLWIGADTNGHLTIAWLVFTYGETLLDPVPAIHEYAWNLIRTTFAVTPGLDEVHLTGLPHRRSPFGVSRHLVTFSAAISRVEFVHASPSTVAEQAFTLFPRVWFHPALLHPQNRLPPTILLPSSGPQVPLPPDRSGKFAGTRGERTRELGYQIAGMTYGGILEGKLYHGDPSRRVVALTFDDGPFPIYTSLLLDTLDRLHLTATFFLVGEQVAQYPYFAKAIAAAGHEVANHSFHHPNLTQLSAQAVEDELRNAQEAIATVTGETPRYFRPPGGDNNEAVLRIARRLGLVTVFWTDDPGDYANLGPRVLEARTLATITSGGIVLLHQGVGDTIRILPQIAEVLQRRGLTLTTVSGLLAPGRARKRQR